MARYPIAQEIEQALTPEVGDRAAACADALMRHFAGSQIYIPLRTATERENRNARIVEAARSGAPPGEIARSEGISYPQVCKILSAHKDHDAAHVAAGL